MVVAFQPTITTKTSGAKLGMSILKVERRKVPGTPQLSLLVKWRKRTDGRYSMSKTMNPEMVTDEEPWGFNLTSYGRCQTVYEGKGILALSSGEQVDCEFHAGQLSHGDVILLCGTPVYDSLLGFGATVESFRGA